MALSIEELRNITPDSNKIYVVKYDIGYGVEVTKFKGVEVINEKRVVFFRNIPISLNLEDVIGVYEI